MAEYDFGSENVAIRKFIVYLREGDENLTSGEVTILNAATSPFDTTWDTDDTIYDVFLEIIGKMIPDADIETAYSRFNSLFTKIGDTIGDSFDSKVENGIMVELTEGGEVAASKNSNLNVNVPEFTANNVEFFEYLDGKKIALLVESTRKDANDNPDIISLYKQCTFNYQENLSGNDVTVIPFEVGYNNMANKDLIKYDGSLIGAPVILAAYTNASGEKVTIEFDKNFKYNQGISVSGFEVLQDDIVRKIGSLQTLDNRLAFIMEEPLDFDGGTILVSYLGGKEILFNDDSILQLFEDEVVENLIDTP